MKVSELMTKAVATCRPDTNLAAAGALMWENDCGILPVVNDQNEVLGVITDRDVCMALTTRDRRPSEISVADVYTHEPATCAINDDVQAAEKTMQEHKVRRLPVIGSLGVLEGILSMNDVVLHADKTGALKTPEVPWGGVIHTFQTICQHAKPAREAALVAAA